MKKIHVRWDQNWCLCTAGYCLNKDQCDCLDSRRKWIGAGIVWLIEASHLLCNTESFFGQETEIFATSSAWLSFKKLLFDWKALNNKEGAWGLTGSDSECSEADERVSPDLARHGSIWIYTHSWLLIVIYKQRFRIILKLRPQMPGGALVFCHLPPLSFPCIAFSIFLHSHPTPLLPFSPHLLPFNITSAENHCSSGVASIKQQADLKSRNSFKDGFVVFLWVYHNYNEGLEHIYAHHRGNLIVTHPWRLWSWVISFHILSIVLACSLCMEGGIENDLPLKS